MIASTHSVWPLVKIGNLIERVESKNPLDAVSDAFHYIDISSVDNVSKSVRSPSLITAAEAPSRARQFVQASDVLVSTVRPSLNAVAMVPDHLSRPIASTGFCVLRSRPALLDPAFLFHFVISNFFVSRLVTCQKGGAYPAVTDGDVLAQTIPLPPMSEQQRIVDTLQEAEEIRRLRAQAKTKTAELIPALFASIFGELYSGKSPFPVCLLSELGELDRGRSRHRPRDEPSLFDGPYPFLQTGDIAQSNGWVTNYSQTYSEKGLEQSRLWPKGTLAITIAANIGSTAILGFDACFPDSVVGFTSKEGVSAEYVRWWLLGYQKKLEIQAPQGAQKNINLEVLRAIRIPVPPKELQDRFDAELEDVREQVVANKKGEATFRLLASSLSAHAFTGNLTADWREKHQKRLAGEARDRDAALQQSGAALPLSRRATIQEMDSIWNDITDGIYADLSREQRGLLREIERMVGGVDYGRYFTAEQLAADLQGPLHRHPHAIESHLAVFAVRGLIIPVSRPRNDSTGDRFAACYRLPLKEDDVKSERLEHQRKLAVGDV